MPKKTSQTRKAKNQPGSVFKSLRKPSAPAGHPMSHAKPDEKARPAGRKAKHKRKPEASEQESIE